MNPTLNKELQSLLNRHSAENDSDTPDYVLAGYMLACLDAFNRALVARECFYGRHAGSQKDPTEGFAHEDYAHNRDPQIQL